MVIGHHQVDTRKRFHAVAQLSLLLGILASKTPLFFIGCVDRSRIKRYVVEK